MSGIFAGGLQLSQIFAPGNSGIATGIVEQGVDIGNRFAAYSGGPHAADTGIHYNSAGGNPDISSIFQKLAASPVGVTVSPPNNFVAGIVPNTLTSGVFTGTASGGTTTGYTYQWIFVSGDGSIAPNSPTSASTTFSKVASAAGTFSANYKLVVTDSGAATGESTPISITYTISALSASISPSSLFVETTRPTPSSPPGTSAGNLTCVVADYAATPTYSWSFTNNPDGAVLFNATLQTCSVSKTGNLFDVTGTLQCIVTDGITTLTRTADFELVRSSAS